MKRNIGLAVAVIFIFGSIISFTYGQAYAKEVKIGYVDLAKVFDEYSKTKETSKTIEDKAKAKETDRKKMTDDLKKLKDEQALLSEKAKAEKQKVIDDKIKALQEFDRTVRDELLKERNDAIGGILKDIENIVMAFSKETGYDLIVNSRTLLYGAPELDLTAEVLKRLNKK